MQQTGRPTILSKNLKLSERMLYHYLNFMKSEMNAPIIYRTDKQSYCYTKDANFCFVIREKKQEILSKYD